MEINGVPLHPLVVHLVVVLGPSAGILAIVYALLPSWRWWARWPMVVAAVVGALATYLASLSGDDLKHKLGIHSALIETHEMWAGRLQLAMWVLAAVAIVAWWAMPYRTRLEGSPDRDARVAVLAKPLVVVLPIVGIVVLVFVVLTGDAGARAVWGG